MVNQSNKNQENQVRSDSPISYLKNAFSSIVNMFVNTSALENTSSKPVVVEPIMNSSKAINDESMVLDNSKVELEVSASETKEPVVRREPKVSFKEKIAAQAIEKKQKEEAMIKENAQDLEALKLMGIDPIDGDFNKTVKKIRQDTLKALKGEQYKSASSDKKEQENIPAVKVNVSKRKARFF